MTTPDAVDENAKIAALSTLNILDTPPEERFDRLTRLARRLFDVPIVFISLVDTNRQWLKSSVGFEVEEATRDLSFCGHVILRDDIFLVSDTLADSRFSGNPLVTGHPHVRFYVGCPLIIEDGSKVGTICLMDKVPRKFDAFEFQLLRDLAMLVAEELAEFQSGTMDELTLLTNRQGFDILAQQSLSVCLRLGKLASLLFFSLNDYQQIVDTRGQDEGDWALATFADILREVFRDSDVIGRLDGNEFVVLLTDVTSATSAQIVERLSAALDAANQTLQRGYDLRFAMGDIEYDYDRHFTIETLIADGEAVLHENELALRENIA